MGGNGFVARFKADGSGIDTTFGASTATPGRLNVNFTSSSDEQALGITLDANGKLVVCGVSGNYAAIARLNADGTFDTTFDSDEGDVPVGRDVGGSVDDMQFDA